MVLYLYRRVILFSKKILVSLFVGAITAMVFSFCVTLVPTDVTETPEYLDKLKIFFNAISFVVGFSVSIAGVTFYKRLKK